jgi:xanthine/uracil/vitamin C permease (AzgA family)
MGAVFISGWFYLFFTFTGLRSMLFRAVPKSLRAVRAARSGVARGCSRMPTAHALTRTIAPAATACAPARQSITVGIGFFITIIGLKIGEITRVTQAAWSIGSVAAQATCHSFGESSPTVPEIAYCESPVDLNFATYEMGMVNYNEHPQARIAVLGLVLVSFFTVLRSRSAIILSIVLCTFLGINYSSSLHHSGWMSSSGKLDADGNPTPVSAVTNLRSWYLYNDARYHSGLSMKEGEAVSNAFFLPQMASIPSGHLSFKYARTPIFWEAVWTFLFVELFDSFGTLTGIMTRAGFMKGDPEKAMTRVNRAMCVDGFGLWLGAIIGSNSITCYIESNTGVEAGARTGLASIVTGSAFLLSLLFIGPFVAVIPDAATTCALVMVGVFSLEGVRDINFDDITESLPAFFTIMTMGFTYSIANGICAGFIFFAWMRTVRFCYQKLCKAVGFLNARAYPDEVDCTMPHPLMIIIAIFCAVRFAYLAPGHQ